MRLIYIDEIDFMIISELKRNSADKLSEIAKKVHLNERSVRRRLGRLIEFKILEPIFLVMTIKLPQRRRGEILL